MTGGEYPGNLKTSPKPELTLYKNNAGLITHVLREKKSTATELNICLLSREHLIFKAEEIMGDTVGNRDAGINTIVIASEKD